MTTTTKAAVTVLGLGAMGSRVAARLAEAGHRVTVWNRSPGRTEATPGAAPVRVATSARDAVADADVVISMVTDDAASRSVWLDPDTGVLVHLPANAVAIEASTITGAMARELAGAADAAGVAFLEAPVVGSRPQADAGALLVLVGGDPAVSTQVEPVLSAYAGGIRHVGDVGAASAVKLAINGLFGIQVAAYAEMLGVMRHADIDDDEVIDILANLPITSPGLQRILGLFAQQDFAPNFPIALVAKDFGYLSELAVEAGVEAPLATAARNVFAAAADSDAAELDIAGIVTRYRT